MSKNAITHIEIPAKDTAAAAKFYAGVFGWKTHLDTSAGINYQMFQASSGPGGAFVETGESFKPGDVTIYVETEDVDASIARAEAAGGKVLMPKMEVPNNGWIAWIADPTGNRVGLFKGPGG